MRELIQKTGMIPEANIDAEVAWFYKYVFRPAARPMFVSVPVRAQCAFDALQC